MSTLSVISHLCHHLLLVWCVLVSGVVPCMLFLAALGHHTIPSLDVLFLSPPAFSRNLGNDLVVDSAEFDHDLGQDLGPVEHEAVAGARCAQSLTFVFAAFLMQG